MKTATQYWQEISARLAHRPCQWTSSEELLASLRTLDVTSHDELIRKIPLLTRQQQIAAIRLFRILEVRRAGSMLMTCWLSEDEEVRGEARAALTAVRSRRAYKRLLAFLYSSVETSRREEACYILSFCWDKALLEPIQKIYANQAFPPAVRAQAVEGLANLLGHVDRRTRQYRQTLALLLPGLHDSSPEVRFWTCFALGSMRARQALPELQRMVAEDNALCPGWWRVSEEASDAVCAISNKPYPDRERIFCAPQFPACEASFNKQETKTLSN